MMKYRFLILFCLLSVIYPSAKPWLELLPDKPRTELTFDDYQHAFQSYWAPYQVTDGYYIENGEKVGLISSVAVKHDDLQTV